MRCAALVGAKPAKAAFPRTAEVLPVVMMAPSPAATIAGASRRARCSSAIVLTWKFRLRTSGSISRKFPNAPPTALWTRTVGVPRSARIAPRVLSSAASSVTSHGYEREPSTSRSSAASRSRFRASIATAYPPREKRRTIAAPVPGPTPVTTTTGFAMLISQTPCRCIGDPHLRGRRRTPPSRARLQHHPEPRLPAHHAVVSLRCFIQRILLDQWPHSGERAELQRILGIDGGPAGPARHCLPGENQRQHVHP